MECLGVGGEAFNLKLRGLKRGLHNYSPMTFLIPGIRRLSQSRKAQQSMAEGETV